MSAFICSDRHIRTVAYHVASYFQIDENQLADKLKSINIDSVNYRYADKTKRTKCKGSVQSGLTNDDIGMLIDSLNYQSCENNTIEYKAYSLMLEQWKMEVKCISRNGAHWTI
jgi:hypothetical protein